MNYFNYFTEVEEHFQRARDSGLFLLSPLDWALLETWKDSDIPLEAVLKGIDRAFEKWHSRKRRFQQVNSLAYCTQEVLAAAREMADGVPSPEERQAEAGFSPEQLAAYFRESAATIRRSDAPAAAIEPAAKSLDEMAAAAEAGSLGSLEQVEQRLTILEERLLAALQIELSEEALLEARREMESRLAPYRRKMDAAQLAMLEKQYLQRSLLEKANLPRLSLFYLRQ